MTFKIITFGCRVNQAESRLMGEQIVKLCRCQIEHPRLSSGSNCFIVDSYKEADLVVINTCCVTNKAEREVRKEIRRVKRENPKCFLVVAGCWTEKILNQLKNSDLLKSTDSKFFSSETRSKKRQSFHKVKGETLSTKKKNLEQSPRKSSSHKNTFSLVNLWLRNEEKEKIGEILKKKLTITDRRSSSSYGKFQDKYYKYKPKYKDKYSKSKKALVKIQDGCDNFCTYCIVPYVRGRSKSRSAKEIIKEINRLVKNGIEEVVLTGISIADYKFSARGRSSFGRKNPLVRLIKVILEKTKIKKISFGSMGLKVFDDEFISLYK